MAQNESLSFSHVGVSPRINNSLVPFILHRITTELTESSLSLSAGCNFSSSFATSRDVADVSSLLPARILGRSFGLARLLSVFSVGQAERDRDECQGKISVSSWVASSRRCVSDDKFGKFFKKPVFISWSNACCLLLASWIWNTRVKSSRKNKSAISLILRTIGSVTV